jgi:hypothetical protein
MSLGYEIFQKTPDGSLVWITAVAEHGNIEQTLQALAWVLPGEYFTRDAATGEVVSGVDPVASE